MIAWVPKLGQETGEWWHAEFDGDTLSLFPPSMADNRWSMIVGVALPVSQSTHVYLTDARPLDFECMQTLGLARTASRLFAALVTP